MKQAEAKVIYGSIVIVSSAVAAMLLCTGCGDFGRGMMGASAEDEVGAADTQQDAVKGRSQCSAEPDPALLGEAMALNVSGMARNVTITVRIQDAAGERVLQGSSNGDGQLTLGFAASVLGAAQVEIWAPSKRGDKVAASCGYTVIEAGVCGNGLCEDGEDCASCDADCGACPPACGDGQCNGSEDCGTCEADCGACPAFCGDGTCDADEDCNSCASDCGACPAFCGDGTCDRNEDCSSCPSDCGACAFCGDGTCDRNEDCSSCETDCGSCPAYCGDRTCDANEDCNSCASDCGACPAFCGDGTCDAGEDCSSCSSDCGSCLACDPAVSTNVSGRHNAGKACMSCHDGSPVAWTIAGTLYAGATSRTAVAGATMHFIDAKGKEFTLITAQNGNFYTSDTSIAFPVRTFASRCPDTQEMPDLVQKADGNCNSCHDSTMRIHLP